MTGIKTHEILLIESIFFSIIWLVDEYIAFLLSIVLSVIIFCILIISIIAEMVEKSKVPRSFFVKMFLSLIPPIVMLILYFTASDGNIEWLEK